jgi:glycosyltransferase involved in cell wall biosynthesis
MGVLEACVVGCPTLCFNTGGQDAFPDNILIKVPVTDSYKENLDGFSQKLRWIYDNKDKAKIVGENAKEYVYKHFTWDNKIAEIEKIYDSLLNKAKCEKNMITSSLVQDCMAPYLLVAQSKTEKNV